MQYCYVHDANGGNSVKSRAERNEIYFNWIEGAMYHELELIGPDPEGAASSWSVDLKREDSDVVGNVLRKTSDVVRGAHRRRRHGRTKGRYRFVNNTIITATGSSAVFRLFDELESVEMHNNIIVTNGTGGPNVMRANAAEFMWVSGVNIAGSNNWVMTGATNIPTQWTGTVSGASAGLTNLMSDPRPAAGSPIANAGNASLLSPAGFAFPNPLWPPGFHPPLRALIPAGSAMARPGNGTIRHRRLRARPDDSGHGRRGRHRRRGRDHGRRRWPWWHGRHDRGRRWQGRHGRRGWDDGRRRWQGRHDGGGGRRWAGGSGTGGTTGAGGAIAGAGGGAAGRGGAAGTTGAGGTTAGTGGGAATGTGGGAGGRGGTTATGTGGAITGSGGAGGGGPDTSSGGCSCGVADSPPPLALLTFALLTAGALRRPRSRRGR